MTRRDLTRIFWIGAAATVVFAALVALTAVLRGDFSDTDGRILGSLAALLLAGGTLIAGLVLIDRDNALLGRLAVVFAPVGLALLLYAIWSFVFDGGGDEWDYGWTGALLLVATLIAVSARLQAESIALTPLAMITGLVGGVAAGVSVYAIWNQESGDVGKVLVALWIVTVACWLLIPVLERFRGAAATADPEVRVLASLDGVELVLTRSRNGLEVVLAPGERLALRRSPRVPG